MCGHTVCARETVVEDEVDYIMIKQTPYCIKRVSNKQLAEGEGESSLEGARGSFWDAVEDNHLLPQLSLRESRIAITTS